ncbi:uncharacterized protein B0T23DRAFT_401583 [Neurospora hispaniola]|uniref:Uncharacterized protein n=1 Tax=Neurospora hispaniola TaxID=588809 RepID=A0AAJ0IGQ7_9PEZI|nr:hypothetical protein B0T23DRAFT_401583 [Neurospora hispaniola]
MTASNALKHEGSPWFVRLNRRKRYNPKEKGLGQQKVESSMNSTAFTIYTSPKGTQLRGPKPKPRHAGCHPTAYPSGSFIVTQSCEPLIHRLGPPQQPTLRTQTHETGTETH